MSVRSFAAKELDHLLAVEPITELAERLLLQIGRRWPDSYPVRSLTWHLGNALGERGREPARLVEIAGGLRLSLPLRDYSWAGMYFRGRSGGSRQWTYEPETTAFVRHWLRPGDTFFDAGANIGYFSLVAAGLVNGGGAIYAFEPHPVVARLLRENVALNQLGTLVRVEEQALAAAAGEIRLYLPENSRNMASASLVGSELRSYHATAVTATTLDQYAEEHGITSVRLIKMDVEGAELDVLRGARRLLRERRFDAIVCEFNPSYFASGDAAWAELVDHLLGYGYVLRGLGPSGGLERTDGSKPTWAWGNVCFLREELTSK